MALADTLPHTLAALRAAAEYVRATWIAMVEGSSLSDRDKDTYVAGLEAEDAIRIPGRGGRFSAEVLTRDPAVRGIEQGRPAYHLPSRINWAATPAARQSKTGRYYLFIPFEHRAYRGGPQRSQINVRLMMPSPIYRVARTLQPGQYLTSNPRGGGASVYAPGMQPYIPRYRRNRYRGRTPTPIHERMIRAPGTRGARSGTYLTFRTMTQDSPGWWIPPRPGAKLVPQVRRATTPGVKAIIAAGVKADLEATLRQEGD